MTRMTRQELERKLEQARRFAMEPTDPRLAQIIEELEFLAPPADTDRADPHSQHAQAETGGGYSWD
jgi:hypothetical protein